MLLVRVSELRVSVKKAMGGNDAGFIVEQRDKPKWPTLWRNCGRTPGDTRSVSD